MNWFLYELMHEGGDGRVEDERYEEEESEDTDDTESPQEHGGVIFDFFKSGFTIVGFLFLPHGVQNVFSEKEKNILFL